MLVDICWLSVRSRKGTKTEARLICLYLLSKKKVILTVLSRLHLIKQLKISEITTNYLEINNRLTFS